MLEREIAGTNYQIYIEDDSNENVIEELAPYLEKTMETMVSFALHKLKLADDGLNFFELSILFCDDQRMQEINSEYRQKDKTTDVLSFPIFESLREGSEERNFAMESVNLGDLMISIPVARRQSVEYKVSFPQEVVHLAVHGLLHLLGFDHELGEEEEKVMFGHEGELVKEIYQKLELE